MKSAIKQATRNKRNKRKITTSEFLAQCAVRRSLRQHFAFWQGAPIILGLVIPRAADIGIYQTAVSSIAAGNFELFDDFYREDTVVVEYINKRPGAAKAYQDSQFEEALASHSRVIVVVFDRQCLPSGFEHYADGVIDVAGPNYRHIIAAGKCCVGMDITLELARLIAGMPLDVIGKTLRKGRSAERALTQMRALNANHDASARSSKDPKLEDLYGMGEATAWGKELAADLSEWRTGNLNWSQVDRGVLLSGPPGTGKSQFAAALARSCEAHLVVGSIAKWQAHGHLGEMLQAMRGSFSEATENAPSILFIDEIDAVGNRDNFEKQNRNYGIQVIAGLLECMDGLERREGVIVVGAANFPHMLDDALVRAGRLDRHIRIELPDAESRLAILKWYLGEGLLDVDLNEVVRQTECWSGAALEKLVRDAGRAARRQKRSLTIDDILAALPQRVALSRAILEQTAVHEAGHVLVGIALDLGRFVRVRLMDSIDLMESNQQVGGATFEHDVNFDQSLQRIEDHVALSLAGAAAEEMIFGFRSPGAGGSKDSDLYRATMLCLKIEASYGLGAGLAYRSSTEDSELLSTLSTDIDLREQVERRLANQFLRAASILQEQATALQCLSATLLEKLELSSEEVFEILEQHMEVKR